MVTDTTTTASVSYFTESVTPHGGSGRGGHIFSSTGSPYFRNSVLLSHKSGHAFVVRFQCMAYNWVLSCIDLIANKRIEVKDDFKNRYESFNTGYCVVGNS